MSEPEIQVQSLRELCGIPALKTPGTVGLNDSADPSPGSAYRQQFRQLRILLADYQAARDLTNWAIRFFQKASTIEEIARGVSRRVDKALRAVNSNGPDSSFFDHYLGTPAMRYFSDAVTKSFAANPEVLVTHRIPAPLAIALVAVKKNMGRCEEHARLSLYLLTIGHMIHNTGFGQLKNDIYYCGAGKSDHAFGVLVKGQEFANAIREAKKAVPVMVKDGYFNNDYFEWFYNNTSKWGANAWTVDGWTGKAIKLAQSGYKLDKGKTWSVSLRDPHQGEPVKFSKYDLSVYSMSKRIAEAYRIE